MIRTLWLQVPDFDLLKQDYDRLTFHADFSPDCADAPFTRCVEPADSAQRRSLTQCKRMGCSKGGQLLIEGEPCDPGARLARRLVYLALSSTLLTCAGPTTQTRVGM